MKHINESFVRKLVREEIRKIREEEEPVKRGRGRPRKSPSPEQEEDTATVKGVRGRPWSPTLTIYTRDYKRLEIDKSGFYKVVVPNKDREKVLQKSLVFQKPFKRPEHAATEDNHLTGEIRFSRRTDSALIVPGWRMKDVAKAYEVLALNLRANQITKLTPEELDDEERESRKYNRDTEQKFEVGDKVVNVKTQEPFEVIELEDNDIVKVQNDKGEVKRMKNYFLRKQE